MRPQVSALISKLKGMQMMTQLGTVEEVCFDLCYWFLYRENQMDRLGAIASKLQSLWVTGMGKNGYRFDQPVADDAGSGAPISALGGTSAEPGIDLSDKRMKLGVEGMLIEHTPDMLPGGRIRCWCNREYDNESQWAAHARIRIWNYMKNDFPAIGGNDGSTD